ncbi:FAD-dependent monooxygenase [Undibacter mobilis]|uniref:Salicylate 1-monooxygenase n=1 Tax=Undibacter mobilis TaxID=2292256 RepID=A0A371B9W4_9BRAD|nr:FAD-dependent monooxygenase [Undibacter mobilis]RDV04297.1 salicylate 1-monooxygenase [Undibacter mobilis]
MARKLRVAIVGGGLGGLAVAQALRGKAEVVIIEQSAQFGEVGAGINVSPNCVKVLREFGLESRLRQSAFEPAFHVFRDWKSGRCLFRADIKGEYEKRFNAPHLSVHRADLHNILSTGLPDASLRFGVRCIAVAQSENSAVAILESGEEVEADVVVGADGIKSAVRGSLFGEDEPEFTGNVAWRFTVPEESLVEPIEPAVTNWLGPGGHVVHYYVRSGRLVNVIAVYETQQWTAESWTQSGDRDELLGIFDRWNPKLITLFKRAGSYYKWGLFDRPPLGAWSVGRITLLGDAAHPMLPFLGQGAAMALEDGLALGLLLSQGRPVAESLHLYERLRLPRTSRAQLGSRGRAAENHLRSPLARLKRNLKFKLRKFINPHSTLHNGEWLYSYDVRNAVGGLG